MTLRPVVGALLVASFALAVAVPVRAEPGTELDRCVPADLRGNAVSFRTLDQVVLPGLVFGDGPSGVLLAPDRTESLCVWLPLARQLAEDGYQVFLHQPRASPMPTGTYGFDLDVRSAALELRRRGATSIVGVAAGADRFAGTSEVEAPVIVVPERLDENAAARDRVRAAVREASPPETLFERWAVPLAVVLFVLVAAGVVVLRRRTTTTDPGVSGGS
ncbi:hypothetical protein ACFWNN_11620 [Lentzea sp. NPDC058450]|uniref:hypothetical protein n=1 Tax=Lentzea sp. NPDC058450 TaxID=3346505 RepID=UPI00364A5D73